VRSARESREHFANGGSVRGPFHAIPLLFIALCCGCRAKPVPASLFAGHYTEFNRDKELLSCDCNGKVVGSFTTIGNSYWVEEVGKYPGLYAEFTDEFQARIALENQIIKDKLCETESR
jgi:hypothetical protein